ncbi:hypothetical protein OIU78_030370, partial [Salix suchowensis]
MPQPEELQILLLQKLLLLTRMIYTAFFTCV